MITVTATEFQQRVGYYFDLAAKGEKIRIEKLKPMEGLAFVLQKTKSALKKKKKMSDKERLLETIEKYSFKSSLYKDALEMQKAVRS